MQFIKVKKYADHTIDFLINDIEANFEFRSSRYLTGTINEDGDGIFDYSNSVITFCRPGKKFEVDFGTSWGDLLDSLTAEGIEKEILRRVALVKKAFDDYREDWTVVL